MTVCVFIVKNSSDNLYMDCRNKRYNNDPDLVVAMLLLLDLLYVEWSSALCSVCTPYFVLSLPCQLTDGTVAVSGRLNSLIGLSMFSFPNSRNFLPLLIALSVADWLQLSISRD